MRQRKAKKMLENVVSTYDSIGTDFDRTRQEPVLEFSFYENYLKPGMFITDIGCGNGRLLKSLAGLKTNPMEPSFHYTGIDNSKKMISIAAVNHPHHKFIPGDFLDLPLKNGTQDAVFSIRAFHHLPDRKTRLKALSEMSRIMQPNGILIMTVWNLWQKKFIPLMIRTFLRFVCTLGSYGWNDFLVPWGKKQKRYYHAFTPSELSDLVQESGFEIEEEFCIKKDKKVPFKQSHDIVIIARKLADQ